MGMLTIPIFAGIFGSKPSTGFLLPLLLFADSIAVFHYKQHTQWKYLLKLSPWVIAGVLIAVWVGTIIDHQGFKILLGAIILSGVALMIWKDLFSTRKNLIDSKLFSSSTGILGGFTSMIGNAAGPIMSLYLISAKLPKNQFIGTRAWFFFAVNIVKIPLHVFIWETITWESFKANVVLSPCIIIGMLIGFQILKRIPEQIFRIIVICAIIGSSVILFVK